MVLSLLAGARRRISLSDCTFFSAPQAPPPFLSLLPRCSRNIVPLNGLAVTSTIAKHRESVDSAKTHMNSKGFGMSTRVTGLSRLCKDSSGLPVAANAGSVSLSPSSTHYVPCIFSIPPARAFSTPSSQSSNVQTPISLPPSIPSLSRLNKVVHEMITASLTRVALISRKRNSFEQKFLPNVHLLRVEEFGAKAVFSCLVTQEMCHYEGFLHTGIYSALVSNLSGLHASCLDRQRRIVITTDLNISFLNKASVGDTLHVRSRVLKLGNYFCLADCLIVNPEARVAGRGQEEGKAEMESADVSEMVVVSGKHSMLFTGSAGQAAAYQREEADEGGTDFM